MMPGRSLCLRLRDQQHHSHPLWRACYWRIEEKDGGTYLQVEFVALSRSIPVIFAWLINPLVKNIRRTLLSNLLIATGRTVAGNGHGVLYSNTGDDTENSS
jgi:hypothetical protein